MVKRFGEYVKGYIDGIKPSKEIIKSKRAFVLKEFVDRLDSDREASGYNKLGAKFYAMKLSHLDVWDMEMFLASCKRAKNFSKHFWWSLKPLEPKK